MIFMDVIDNPIYHSLIALLLLLLISDFFVYVDVSTHMIWLLKLKKLLIILYLKYFISFLPSYSESLSYGGLSWDELKLIVFWFETILIGVY